MKNTLFNLNLKYTGQDIINYLNLLKDSPIRIVMLIIDIAIVLFLAIKLIQIIKETRAWQLIKGIAFLIIFTLLSSVLELHILNYILTSFMTYGVILLIIIFQPELRRALEQLGTSKITKFFGFDKDIEAFAASYINNLNLYFTINAVVSHAIYLPVIEEIHKLIRNRLQDRNEFLLSEMNHLLAGMIGESDAPFIYEKVGTQIKNYLLDEFQDTSSMQWKNFVPLIGDSVAYGNENLVVGDVKQSIYRWRNSDWKILAHKIKDEYGANCNEETLEDNWRSLREIVNFNNGFFTKLVKILDNEKKNEEEKIET